MMMMMVKKLRPRLSLQPRAATIAASRRHITGGSASSSSSSSSSMLRGVICGRGVGFHVGLTQHYCQSRCYHQYHPSNTHGATRTSTNQHTTTNHTTATRIIRRTMCTSSSSNNNDNNNNNKDNNNKNSKMLGSGGLVGSMFRSGGLLGALTVLAGKGKWLLGVAKLTKLSSLLSMGATVATYSMFYGWPYACGMVGQIYIHELGHVLAMVRNGIKVGPMVFIPFMGAAVSMESSAKSAFVEAEVALAGPAFGTLAALVPFAYGFATQSQLAFALADFGFMVNLFNLTPIGFLDGGRVAPMIHRNFHLAGLGLGGLYMYLSPSFHPLMFIIMLGGIYNAYQRWNGTAYEPPGLHNMPQNQRLMVVFGYFGLIALLAWLLYQNSLLKKDASQLRLEALPVELTVDEKADLVLLAMSHDRTKLFPEQLSPGQIQAKIDFFRRPGVFKVEMLPDGTVTFSVPLRRGQVALRPGTRLTFRKGGYITLDQPDESDHLGWSEVDSLVAEALGVPTDALERTMEGGLKLNMKSLELESPASFKFFDEDIFRLHLDKSRDFQMKLTELARREGK
mmetsp:Transcript_13744/g.24828  ORF Transcript_13744/g.24828 Transcript_13744/m.24828 type:complete len:566 (+) Transcript_13744:249-1946(+)